MMGVSFELIKPLCSISLSKASITQPGLDFLTWKMILRILHYPNFGTMSNKYLMSSYTIIINKGQHHWVCFHCLFRSVLSSPNINFNWLIGSLNFSGLQEKMNHNYIKSEIQQISKTFWFNWNNGLRLTWRMLELLPW